VVDDRRFQPDGPPGRVLRVWRDSGPAAPGSAGKGLWNHEINGNIGSIEPGAWLAGLRIEVEARRAHRFLKQRLRRQRTRVKSKVTVFGRLGQSDWCSACMQVDRLRAHHDHRVDVLPESFKCVK
jgi:hypothetical protein